MSPEPVKPSYIRRIRDWLRMKLASPQYQKVYFFYWKAKENRRGVLAITTLLLGTVTALFFRARLSPYLSGLDKTLLPQLCFAVGAALVGLIAVVFTLSLFVVQQISAASVHSILRKYTADTVTWLIYLGLAGMAVACLGVGLMSQAKHAFLMAATPILSVSISLALLLVLFSRVVRLSDPANVISYVFGTGVAQVQRLKKLREEFLRLNPQVRNEVDPFGRPVDQVGMALAVMYRKVPFLTKRLADSLDQLHSLMRHFFAQKQYQLLENSGMAVANLLGKYIAERGSSLEMANTALHMIGAEAQWDRLVVASMRAFESLMQIAAELGDSHGGQALARPLGALGRESVQFVPFNAPPDEQPTTAFIVGFLLGATQRFVARRDADVPLTSNEQLSMVAAGLAKGGYSSTLRWMINEWSTMGALAITTAQQITATDTASSLLKVFGFIVGAGDGNATIIAYCRDLLCQNCELEATLASAGKPLGSRFSIRPDTPLKVTFSSASPVALQNTHRNIVQTIANSYSDEQYERWSHATTMLTEFNDGLFIRLEKIGIAGAAAPDPVLIYLDDAARAIAEQLLWLWSVARKASEAELDFDSIEDSQQRVRAAMRAHRRKELPDELGEMLNHHVITFYSRCRRMAAGRAARHLAHCLQSAIDIAVQVLGCGLPEVAADIVETVGRSCAAAIKEGGVGQIIESCRMAAVLCEIGFVAWQHRSQVVLQAADSAISECVGQGQTVLGSQIETLPLWQHPFKLLTEEVREFASGEHNSRFLDHRYTVWRPTFSREAVKQYLIYVDGARTNAGPSNGIS